MSDLNRFIVFHPGAGAEFRRAVLEGYNALPAILRERLRAYAGDHATIIRTVRRPHAIGQQGDYWAGLSVSPSTQRHFPRQLPVAARGVTSLGRHLLFVAEHRPDGTPTPRDHVPFILAHEVGHRIDWAIGGDNYLTRAGAGGIPAPFSHHRAFIRAVQLDLYDAGWRPWRSPPSPPGFHMNPHLLPRTGDGNWARAAQEIFAELFAVRYLPASHVGRYFSSPETERERLSLGIFRRTSRLVDEAVATFAGQSVIPVNTYNDAGNPTPLGVPTDAERARALAAGEVLFRPVRPDAAEPPPP